jgi:hypothetical protein
MLVSLPFLKEGASSFIGCRLSSNVLSRSYTASTGRTGCSTRPPARRLTPLPKQLHWIATTFAPYILSLKGEVLRRRGIIQCEPEVKPNRMLDDGGNW